jgi:hypothetical protein
VPQRTYRLWGERFAGLILLAIDESAWIVVASSRAPNAAVRVSTSTTNKRSVPGFRAGAMPILGIHWVAFRLNCEAAIDAAATGDYCACALGGTKQEMPVAAVAATDET